MTTAARHLLRLATVFAFALGAPRPSLAADAYVEGLVARALAARLHEDVQWLRLGHYRSRTFGGHKSESDGRLFFLADEGKTDPRAELAATIRAFFGPDPKRVEHQHPTCRFPARFLWLDSKLHFDRRHLPPKQCKRFVEFYTALRPAGATIIFSSYYLNSPASAFGHTFLRINKERPRFSAEQPELLDYGIDFAAQVDTGNFLIYAMKGIFGLFPGTFRRVPYYLKVREYNDYESRDLWEYELDFDRKELTMLVAHLWELGSTHFNYYYLDENCSYHILGAIEAAKPDAHLLDHTGLAVIPADTLKALYRVPGLVRSVQYRPSPRTQFVHRVKDLSERQMVSLMQLASNPDSSLEGLSVEERVGVLDAAIDLADSRYAKELLKDDAERDVEVADYKQKLLMQRAEVLVPSEDFVIAPPVRRMPHLGHGTQRWGLGSGFDSGQGYFHSLRFRVALHDLADPAAGYPEMSQVDFLPAEIRYNVEQREPWFEEAMLLDITSLLPWTRYDLGMSWLGRIGASHIRDDGCDACVTGVAEAAAGVTLGAFDEAAVLYVMSGAQIRGIGPIDGGIADLPLRGGVGPYAGLRLRFSDDFIAFFQGRWLYLPTQTPWHTWLADGAIRWQFAKDVALGVEGSHEPNGYSLQGTSFLYF